ncbi:hypothetical protein NX059_000849 [Plenodomus lindquistii]|nr:hypothetical protein NX059_000849 [Plenodomus lindquistii]
MQFPLSEERTKPSEEPDEEISETTPAGQKRSRDRDDDDMISQPSDDEEDPTVDESPESPKVRATIEYPYPANECRRGPQVRKYDKLPLVTTVWAKETSGRRERQYFKLHSPSSDVDSTPKSPLLDGTDDDSVLKDVPIGSKMTKDRPMTLDRRSGRDGGRLHSAKCRAFWTHTPDDCFYAYPEQPLKPGQPEEAAAWPTLRIDIPKDASLGGADGYVPQSGITHYEKRLKDHFALLHNIKYPGPKWPRIGMRVPYEPMTFDDLRLTGAANKGNESAESAETAAHSKKIIAQDAVQRRVQEICSLAFPIIEESQRVYGGDNDPPEDWPEEPKDEPSDSENDADTFHSRYMDTLPTPTTSEVAVEEG